MPAITTYHHHPHPRDLGAPSDCMGSILSRVGHIADSDPHTRSPYCAAKPVIAVGHVSERDLHLDDHSHRSENHPHSELLQDSHCVGIRHIVRYPCRVRPFSSNLLLDMNLLDDNRTDTGPRNPDVAAAVVVLLGIAALVLFVASPPLVCSARPTEGLEFEGASAELWPSTRT